jgi:uncharacterized protein (DUF305 family)
VSQMIIEHQHGIELANIAIAKSSYLDLLEVATTISATQAGEVEQLQNWLSQRGLDTEDPQMSTTDSAVSPADRSALDAKTGFDFDDEWINRMSEQQTRSIDLAAAEIDTGSDPTAVELATSIRDVQRRQLDRMKEIFVIKP